MDPQERKQKIDEYGRDYSLLSDLVKGLSKEEMQYKPGPEKWSAHEIIVHIADAEANSYVRLRKALAEPGGMVFAYEQDDWARELDYMHQDADLHLELFRLLREANYNLIKTMPEQKWQNQYNHSEYGLIGLEKWFEIYLKHIPGHVEQIKRNLKLLGNEAM